MKKIFKLLIAIVVLLAVILLLSQNKNTIMKKFYVIEYSEFVEKYSEQYNVDKYLVYAIIKAESNFNAKAKSSKGAKGLMQLMDSTGQETAKKEGMTIDSDDLFDPEINIKLGIKYMSKLIQKYEQNCLALAAYNAGSGNVDSWIKQEVIKQDGSNIENIPYKETNNYVRRILKDYEIYKELYVE